MRSICHQIFLIFFCCIALNSAAQNEAILEPQLLYRKSFQYGINLNSASLGGLNFKYGWQKTGNNKNILDIELARVRHPKETRIYGNSDNPQQYTYGRLNMAFFLRTGLGNTIKLTERPYKNAIGVNFNYSFGINTALLKPIYLDILHIDPPPEGSGVAYVLSERYDPNVHVNQDLILGNASFFDGFSKIRPKIGGYGKTSVSVEWGQFPDVFYTLEAGFTVDYFPNALPLMAYYPDNHLFFILFLGFTYGVNK